ncbi:hypothetical protein MNV49_006115 [Pseudohyphozyma bogoriensis]|nr:hypothetical protein MNV49_006115 [Pseudohyphozyma bogoriensis]
MLPHELCSRLSNASLARHRYVPLLPTSQHLSILTVLLSQGFITSLSYGSTQSTSSTPPSVSSWYTSPTPQKRLWAELKYRNERPVLGRMSLVSSPSRKVFMTKGEVERFVLGNRVKFVKGLDLGEVAVVKTAHGWMDAREAVKKGLGGEVVARVG